MKKLYAKFLLLKTSYSAGRFGILKRYRNMAHDIREQFGEITWENYCKYVNKT
jgi:hypothetical protein